MARLAILWHLHQPDYRDPESGRPFMPWVRLHALRGYRDLVVETAERRARWTLNVVPSLLDQLDAYAAGGGDEHLDDTRAPADSVDPERIRRLPAGHPAMTRAHPAYEALRARADAAEPLTVGELRDLQVWATLAWFGATARRDYEVLRELIVKGRGFDEADKAAMLEVQAAILRDLPSRFAPAVAAGGTLSTSPYYHPILPLLIDVRSGRRAQPELPDDTRFAWPEDARRQLVEAKTRAARLVGAPPRGLWPSEGAVSPEVVALAGELGFRWLATDRGVLERSGRDAPPGPGPWDLGSGVIGFFRDTDLSDRIGFRYARRDADDAVAELAALYRERAAGRTLVLALDGENPWETYADAGSALRARLVDALGPELVGLDEAAEEPVAGRVHALHTGSWIGGNLRIWVGHDEDRAAWRALAAARAAVAAAEPGPREVAMRHVLAAEGSDWFWWYGDDFDTVWADHFDRLFRAHLAAAWRAIGRAPPEELAAPIRAPRLPGGTGPSRFLPLDPRDPTDAAGWLGAGEVRFAEGSMAAGHAASRIRFGWSRAPGGAAGPLWLRIDGRGDLRLDPAPDASWPVAGRGGFVARYDGGGVSVVVRSPDGARWPEEGPVALAPPAHPSLAWWQV